MTDFSALIVASVPPPVTGQSVATAMLLHRLEADAIPHEIVDVARKFHTGAASYVKRAFAVAGLPIKALGQNRKLPPGRRVFYLQLGQSHQSFLRDLPLLEVARRLGLPTVVHVHGGGFRAAFDSAPTALQTAMRRALREVDRAIVLSSGLRPLFEGLMDEQRVAVVVNGVDAALAEHAAALPTPKPPKGGLTVLYLSNIMETKGYAYVLEAAKLCQERGLPHKFVLAGGLTESSTVDPNEYIAEHGLQNAEFVGPAYGDDKLALLASADAFTLPSFYPTEGQPISILEAMHYGLPVITTTIGGISDVIVDSEHGVIVQPRSAADIVDAVERLAADKKLHRAIIKRNQRDARELYTEQAHGAAMLEVLDGVAAHV